MTTPTSPLDDVVTVQMTRSMLGKRIPPPCVGKIVGPPTVMPTFDAWFTRFTYKPGYEMTLAHPHQLNLNDPYEPVVLGSLFPYSHFYLKAYVPNATTDLHEPYLLQFTAIIPHHLENHGDQAQQDFLRNVLKTFELHERDEWFRVDGKEVFEAHASEIR